MVRFVGKHTSISTRKITLRPKQKESSNSTQSLISVHEDVRIIDNFVKISAGKLLIYAPLCKHPDLSMMIS